MADLTAEETEAAKLVAEAEKVKAEAEEKAKTEVEKLKMEIEVSDHEHRWKRGILAGDIAGGKYVKSCFVDGCGKIEQIAFEEWQTISDR